MFQEVEKQDAGELELQGLVTNAEEELLGEKDAVVEITMLAENPKNASGIKERNVRSAVKRTDAKDVK